MNDICEVLTTRPIDSVASIVIFGGTGDLARRKLIPALSRLSYCGIISEKIKVIITGRQGFSRETLIKNLQENLNNQFQENQALSNGFEKLIKQLNYVQLVPEDNHSVNAFKTRFNEIRSEHSAKCIFYFALPPEVVEKYFHIVNSLFTDNEKAHCRPRLILEKPFGSDLKSAIEINQKLLSNFNEDQIYRIDHYLGKEAVQNIMVLRFANILFEPIWNRSFVDHVQISFAEKIGVGNRATYFDKTGILRDVVQNHLLQVLCLIAMEPPSSNSPDAIRNEKLKVLQSIRPIIGEQVITHTVRGQYSSNNDCKEKVPGYLQEKDIPSDSQTETFAALHLNIDSWRWHGVPFFLRAGKRLSTNLTEVLIRFKDIPYSIFNLPQGKIEANSLTIRIQPDEGVQLSVMAKKPGMRLNLAPVALDFTYRESFGNYRPDAYERLLVDVLHGDQSLFLRNDEIEASWKLIDPIVKFWQDVGKPKLVEYPAFSEGPEAGNLLIKTIGRSWKSLNI